jgi:teichuronic acid biosynthesis glycosyltransferase TuaC
LDPHALAGTREDSERQSARTEDPEGSALPKLKLLVLAATYPFPARQFAGIFNERSVLALKEQCESVEVLSPRPYAPPVLSSFRARWRSYSTIRGQEIRNGVRVFRPACIQVPRIGMSFWIDRGAFLQCRRIARQSHRRVGFDAILAFDLVGTGGVAWRLGQDLGIPAGGWATGGDLRVDPSSGLADVVRRALSKLDIVFYQSHELRRNAGMLLNASSDELNGPGHIVLPRGIAEPPALPREEIRSRLRAEFRVRADQHLILSVGRLTRPKGVFDLVEAFARAADQNPNLRFVLIGADPGFDDSGAARQTARSLPGLADRLLILPACPPDKVWEFLCAADVFAFGSHNEGMPNGLLEAMAMGLPAVAFAIPPVMEIEGGTGALLAVAPFDCRRYADAILELSGSESVRLQMAARAQEIVRRRFDIHRNMGTALLHLQRRIERKNPQALVESQRESILGS